MKLFGQISLFGVPKKPNTKYQILFGIEIIRIPNMKTTIRSNYLISIQIPNYLTDLAKTFPMLHSYLIVNWLSLQPLLQSSTSQYLVVDIGLKCKAMFAPPIQGEIETWIFGILLFLTFGKGLIKYQNIFYVWWMKKTLTKKGFIAIFQLISTKYSKDPSFVTKYNSFRTHMYDAGLKFILCWFALF